MSTTTIITCTDCGAELRRDLDRVFQLCDGCMSRWFALAVIGAPSRERDDFEDADDVDSEPLPPSDWWQMDLATQDRVTGRQQTGMAGGDR